MDATGISRRQLTAAAAATAIGGLVGLGAASAAGTEAGFRAKLPGLRIGANLERWFPIASNNHARRLGTGWWEGLREAGFDHVRLFVPRASETGTGEEIPRLFVHAVEDATRVGVPVFLGLADFYYEDQPWTEAEWAAFDTRARLFARATDPDFVALAPLNEPAFSNRDAWLPLRDHMLSRLRAAAPRHTLSWGGHEWCSWRSLLVISPPDDPNTVAEVHDYQGGNASAVAERFGDAAEWGRRHGVPVAVTELGGRLGHQEDTEAWAADLEAALPVLGRLGLPATLWAITHGGAWRLQDGEHPHPRGPLARVVQAAARRR